MRISDWRSDVCSSDLIPVRQTGATRLVVSCRAPTIKPLSVSTRLFRHPPFVCVQELMARPKRQEDQLLPVPLPRRRPSRANTRNLAASVKPALAAEIKSLAEREQTSVAALVEEATINLLKARSEEPTFELKSLIHHSYTV